MSIPVRSLLQNIVRMLRNSGLLKTSLRRLSSARTLRNASASDISFDYKGNESSLENQAKKDNDRPRVHPLSELGNTLNQELKDKTDVSDVYAKFNEGVTKFKNTRNGEERLQKSYGLTSAISRMLQTSIVDKQSKVDPYEILNNICDSHLARSQHFLIVMKHFLSNKLPQDVMSLWIRYLSLITENPGIALPYNGKDNHKDIVALTTVAYLLLPNNTPDIKVLNQILQVKDASDASNVLAAFDNSIPITLIRPTIFQMVNKNEMQKALKKSDKLLFQYISNNKDWFKKELSEGTDAKLTLNYYDIYRDATTGSSEAEPDVSIVSKFMEAFVSFNRPNISVKVYNDFKPSFKDNADAMRLLNDELLVVVADLPSNSNIYRASRIQAIWNSLIKADETIAPHSYAKLFDALLLSKNIEEVEATWETEVPAAFKKDQTVLEAYLNAVLRLGRFKPQEKALSLLPATIKSSDLINAVLLKELSEPEFKFDKFSKTLDTYYGSTNSKDGQVRRLPNPEALAIKMFGNYIASNDKPSFQFLNSIGINPRTDFLRQQRIVDYFISISPSIEPIRALFAEIKEPVNSKKYKQAIDAEFSKRDGSAADAEALFRDYLDKSELSKGGKSAIRAQYVRGLIDSMIVGFCDVSMRERSLRYMTKIHEYYSLMDEINSRVANSTDVAMLHAYAMLARIQKKKINEPEKKYITDFLAALEKRKFHANQGDLRILRFEGIAVPESLFKKGKSKAGKTDEAPATEAPATETAASPA